MTIEPRSAPELRRLIADVYLAADPPPGASRASWLTTLLYRQPTEPETLAIARDFLGVVDLRRRLALALTSARLDDDAPRGLVIHGLLGHADAALLGATREPGWRAMALDMLDPDGAELVPLGPATAGRLFALALGLGDGAGG